MKGEEKQEVVQTKQEEGKNVPTEVATEHTKQSFFSRLRLKRAEKKKTRKQELEKGLSEEESHKVEEKIEEVNKEIEESHTSSKGKKIWKIIFFVLNIVLVVGVLIWDIYTSGEKFSFGQIENGWYLLLAFVFLALIVLADVMSVHRLIYKKTMMSRWALSYKSMATWRYYNGITPIPNGGQTFMVGYLSSRDIPGAAALSIPVAKLMFQNTAWLLMTIVCLIISFANGITGMVSVISVVVFCFTLVMMIVMFTFSSSKKICVKVAGWAIRGLVKVKILKDYDKSFSKVTTFIDDYQQTMKDSVKAKFDVVYQFLLNAGRFILLYSIPFFICCAFTGRADASIYSDFFVYTVLVDLATAFIPLPGGVVFNEITFAWLFRSYLGGSVFFPLLIWRFCDYYFYLLQGLGVFLYDTFYGNKKYKWVQKRRLLQAESREFKQIQIENFRAERALRRKKQNKFNSK